MINKKLITSLCKISFDFGEFNDPLQYQLYSDAALTQRINLPEPQFIYLHSKVSMPIPADGAEVYVKNGNTQFKYHIYWKWNFDDEIEGDTEITSEFSEIKYDIEFVDSSFYPPTNYTYVEGCAKEEMPGKITGISNGTVVSGEKAAEAIAFGTDYNKNEFRYVPVASDTQKHRFIKSGWIDQHDNPFVFGENGTLVTEPKMLRAVWIIKTWDLTVNYNGAYYNDISVPGNDTIVIQDRFSLASTPNYASQGVVGKLSYTKNVSLALRNFSSVTGRIKTHPTWYLDSNRTNAFNVNEIIEDKKTIYAKWGALDKFTWTRRPSVSSDQTVGKNYSKYDSIYEDYFICPSFGNSTSISIVGGGGNSRLVWGARVKPAYEQIESIVSTPGSNGKTASANGSPKKKFKYFVGGSQIASWLKSYDDNGASVNITAAAGTNGGTDTDDGDIRFNLGDTDYGEEQFTGGGNIFRYFTSRYGSGKTIYSKEQKWKNGTNVAKAVFVGTCNSARGKLLGQTIDLWLYVDASVNNEVSWYRYFSSRFGHFEYDITSESDENTNYGWVFYKDANYVNNNPHRASWNGSAGCGGFAFFSSALKTSDSKDYSSSYCAGNGGAITVVSNIENIPNFSI